MKKGVKTFIVVVLLAACVGFGIYLAVSRPPAPISPPTKPHAEAVKPLEKVKVYRVAVENNRPVLRATETDVQPGEVPAEAALRQLVEQGDQSDLANPMPKGTRLLGLKIVNGLATVNLSREFRDNFSGGSEDEGATIGAILRTLGQFKEIKKVQFLVEGKPIDTLGHLDISGPQDVNATGSGFGGEN